MTCHLFSFAEDLVVLVGEHNLNVREKSQRTHFVAQIIAHPDYGTTQYMYDKDIGLFVFQAKTISELAD